LTVYLLFSLVLSLDITLAFRFPLSAFFVYYV
jgi:hypothetical protein